MSTGDRLEKFRERNFSETLEDLLARRIELGPEPPFIFSSSPDKSYCSIHDGSDLCLECHQNSQNDPPCEIVYETVDHKSHDSSPFDSVEECLCLPQAKIYNKDYLERKYAILAVNFKRQKKVEEIVSLARETLEKLNSDKRCDCSSDFLRNETKDIFERKSVMSVEMKEWERKAQVEKALLEKEVCALKLELLIKKSEYEDLIKRVREYTGQNKSCSNILKSFFISGK